MVFVFVAVYLALKHGTGDIISEKGPRVCYDEMREGLRCFILWYPFTNSLGHVPASPTEQNITFLLYTNASDQHPQLLKANDVDSMQSSDFQPSDKTKVIVHGFADSSESKWISDMVHELLENNIFNVIVVNWSRGAKGPNYMQAVANTRVVGAQIASLILTSEEAGEAGAAASRFHVIGHSLGSHIAGYAGTALKGRLGRITGLDAAAPQFEKFRNSVKLDKTDAIFVDAIHTDAEPLHHGGLGTTKLYGHVDFFPNGGYNMPGCPTNKLNISLLLAGKISAVRDDASCSHGMAYRYFTASIKDNDFTAYPCNATDGACHTCGSGCSNMGLHANTSLTGLFVLTTKEKYPY